VKLYDYAENRENFYINDINYISASYGLDNWNTFQHWYMYKTAMTLDAVPEFSFNIANIIKSIFGRNKKALALDLDNTLWGGIVGDDGVDGIEIGEETPNGQAFREFQGYIKAHKNIGVMLTVCSKNEEENAIAGLNHPDCQLRPNDFVNIKANWENKDININNTAAEMNIFPDSFVFLDDNPAERAIVSHQIHGIAVPNMDGVENYIRIVDRNGYFEVTNFSDDDLNRNKMYEANAARTKAQNSFESYSEYLLSLNMKAEICDFKPMYLQRITQLTNKSNQFNLTTKRYTTAEMEKTVQDRDSIRLCGRLEDKFGDNGIVTVAIGHKELDTVHIDLWLMSCRVLKRDMELAMLDRFVEECVKTGAKKIKGYYYKTAKNKMVSQLLKTFGFKLVEENGEDTVWEMYLEGYKNQNHVIKLDE
ncbi:MAG: HAD-IIIC family phosphatase, partial [Clostridiales bacterium]|nr:HAD-IIIC family phosphatase [Clostridiales bacterium]